jgi:hypothetical protein
MDMILNISGPFISTELIETLFVNPDISQSNNIPFGNILYSLLGNLQLQNDNLIHLGEGKGRLNTGEGLNSEPDLKEFPADQNDKDLEHTTDYINQIIFLKEIYNYLSQSGQLPTGIKEQLEDYIHYLDDVENYSPVILRNDFPSKNDLFSKDLQLFNTSLSSPVKEIIQFINKKGKGSDLSGIDIRDFQIFRTSLFHAIKEVIQLFNTKKDGTDLTQKNHSFLNKPQISDFDFQPFTKSDGIETGFLKENKLPFTNSGNGDIGFLEKDVIPVFIREIKSSLSNTDNIKPIIAEEILNADGDVAQGEMSKDKGHNQTSSFNNSSGTENTFFTIEDNKGKVSVDFNAPDKTFSIEDKHNDLYAVSKKGDASIEISLEPDGIGEIDIELVLDKGVINAQINVSENMGKEFIEKNLDNIMRALINEGLHVGSFSVSLQNKQDTSMYYTEKEDIKDIRLENAIGLPNAVHNEGLISIFV